MLAAFFDRYPDDAYQTVASRSLETLLTQRPCLTGDAGGWTGGLVHAIAKQTSLGRHVILNSEFEAMFGVSIGTVRKRAAQVWDLIGTEALGSLRESGQPEDLTLRDEANAICAFAFRNGYIEEIHASVDSDDRPRITDPEMKRLMVDASRKLAEVLEMKDSRPLEYYRFISGYNRAHCRNWER